MFRFLSQSVTKKSPSLAFIISVSRENSTYAAQIVAAAEAAVNSYIEYQGSKIGLDINPDELVAKLKAAGVKRAVIRSPQFKVLDNFSIASCTGKTVNFVGLEDN